MLKTRYMIEDGSSSVEISRDFQDRLSLFDPEDANEVVLPTSSLEDLLEAIRQLFPELDL